MTGAKALAKPSPQERAAPRRPSAGSLFAWSVWALTTVAALWLVAHYGRNVPQWDDWEMAPVLAGAQPVTPSWLWSQHNEHRIPLPRLLLLSLVRVSGNDFRAGMVFNVLALAALAAALMVAARRVRGSPSWADAFFPLILLHWGHAENLLWGWQVGFVSSTAVALALLAILAVRGNRLTRGTLLGVGACLLLLPLCGANGLVLVPPLALWLGWGAYHGAKTGQLGGRADRLAAVVLLLAVAGLVAAYLVGYRRPEDHPPSPGVGAALQTSLECWAMTFGLWGRHAWLPAGLAAAGLWAAAALLAARAAWRLPADRPRALGLGLFLAGLMALALVVGWGRSAAGPASGLTGRYVSLMTPALCCLYFLLGSYVRPHVTALAQGGLTVVAGLVLLLNAAEGLEQAEGQCRLAEALERDLGAALPPFVLVDRYSRFPQVLYPDPVRFARYLPLLREAGVGPFRQLRDDPDFREVPLADGRNASRRPDGTLVLSEARFVYAIRLRYRFDSGRLGYMGLRACWGDSGPGEPGGPTPGDTVLLVPEREEKAVLFWVNGRVGQLWFRSTDRSALFQVAEIVLLVPRAGEERPAARDGTAGARIDSGSLRQMTDGKLPRVARRRTLPRGRSLGMPSLYNPPRTSCLPRRGPARRSPLHRCLHDSPPPRRLPRAIVPARRHAVAVRPARRQGA